MLVLDKENGNNSWGKSIAKEIFKVAVDMNFLKPGESYYGMQ